MTISRTNLVSLKLLLCVISVATAGLANAQQTRPECVYQSTDSDGDGFGYENNTTCLITANSIGEAPVSNECIDDNADGWGWNGVESCVVPIPEATCIDTDPIGDGWGWDGVTSCRVVPELAEFNELKEIEKHFIDVTETLPDGSNRAAVATCPSSIGPYLLKHNGSLFAAGRRYNGLWSSGISTSDNRVRMAVDPGDGQFIIVLIITEDGVWEGGTQTDETRCQWSE